jgi:hypothetical protein
MSDAPAPQGRIEPHAYLRSVAETIGGEWDRRLRRAVLISAGAGLLAVFALGASVLPTWLSAAVSYDLRIAYLAFLAVYGITLAYLLVRATADPYGAALWTAEVSRAGTIAAWQRVTGERRLPKTVRDAVAWLGSHPETDTNRPQRLMVQISAGDLAGARDTLSRYPTGTPFERYWRAADAWFLDVLEGGTPSLDPVEAEVARVEVPAERAHAESGVAVLRAHREMLSGRDWIAPLAAARPLVEGHTDDTLRVKLIVGAWTTFMAVAAGMIGLALLAGVATGIVR